MGEERGREVEVEVEVEEFAATSYEESPYGLHFPGLKKYDSTTDTEDSTDQVNTFNIPEYAGFFTYALSQGHASPKPWYVAGTQEYLSVQSQRVTPMQS